MFKDERYLGAVVSMAIVVTVILHHPIGCPIGAVIGYFMARWIYKKD